MPEAFLTIRMLSSFVASGKKHNGGRVFRLKSSRVLRIRIMVSVQTKGQAYLLRALKFTRDLV